MTLFVNNDLLRRRERSSEERAVFFAVKLPFYAVYTFVFIFIALGTYTCYKTTNVQF